MAGWKRDFASGLVVLVPLLVVAFVVSWLYGQLATVPVAVDPPPLRVAVTLVVFVLLVFAIGYLMRTALGGVVEGVLDDVVNQIPGLRVVYNASKMAVETAVGGTDELQAPVKVETWDGLRMTAFKTGKKTDDGRELLFLPTAPNITTGFVVEVEPDRYEETGESVEDALTRVLSAGFGDTEERDVQELFEDD
ncbi:DUF502 domain-containing protein [Salinirussus salinus]|jgi:uncharacterized membrane protein|uniref:DUF502 domain-containing protein n=1 Tax=Salinirussus salinus TaxID=1198300 RepID=UPI0013567B3F|nr:DUF502 domain-containing protein [Salinirussus salinus]